MPVVQDEISLVKVANGDDGRGILGTPVATYAKSTSGTTPPTSWSATRPNVPAGQYLWTRVVTTYTDNTTSETQTPTLMGKPGESGLGIKEKSINYAAGTSGNTPPTTGWQEMIPTVASNQYLWTRTTLVYTDDSKTDAYSVGKMGANGADAQLLYLTASAENMAFNADDTPKTTQTINISAKLQNVTGTATFTAIPYIGNTAQPAITLGGSGNTRTLTSAQWTNKNWTLVAITATLDNLNDTLSIVKVKDGAKGDQGATGPKGDQGNQGIQGPTGADGKPSYTHWAYAWSADGTDRFTTTYPNANLFSGAAAGDIIQTTTFTGWGNTNIGDVTPVTEGETYTGSIFYESVGTLQISVRFYWLKADGTTLSESGTGNYIQPGATGWSKVQATAPAGAVAVKMGARHAATSSTQNTVSYRYGKIEVGSERTFWVPNGSEDFVNAYPTYAGSYVDSIATDSNDPTKYTWQRILGESGQDGKDGEDGVNGQDAKEVISGYLSNDSIIVPANASGTVTDFAKALGDFIIYEGQTKVSSGVTYSKVSETGMTSTINSSGRYTVTALSADVGTATYQAVYKAVTIQKIMIVVKNKQGATGPAGANGTDGKGIVSSATTYQAGTSGTTPPTGTWSTSIPSVSENQYLWTKIVLTYSDNTNSTAYSVGKMGAKGETGATGSTGATGNGIKSTTINFASSTSGTTAPSSGWSTSIPTVAAGSFLWTRTVLTFTDNTTNTSYTVAKQGEKGDPTGIISQSTVPTNPYVGMLWQNTGASGYIIGATYQWNGSKFNLYIFTADNIVATTLSAITANLGNVTAGTLSGTTITSSFQRDTWSGSAQAKKGAIQIEGGYIDLTYDLIQKSNSTVLSKGGYTLDENGFIIYTNDVEGGLLKNTQYLDDGIYMNDTNLRQYGTGKLTFQDLIKKDPSGLLAATGFSQYNTSSASQNYPTARRIGRIVQLSGAFKNNAAASYGASGVLMGYLPAWAYPSSTVNFVVQGSGMNRFMITVTSNGEIMIERYGTDDYKQAAAGSWLNISCLYAAGDF